MRKRRGADCVSASAEGLEDALLQSELISAVQLQKGGFRYALA